MTAQPFLAYTARHRMPCCFYTLVIRNVAITEKFSGGLGLFLRKYRVECNRHIAVACFMSGDDPLEIINDMVQCGLKPDVDFIVFDAAGYEIARSFRIRDDAVEDTCEIDLGVDWLRAELSSEGVHVWYVHG